MASKIVIRPILCLAIQCNAMQCNAMQFGNASQYNTCIASNTIQHSFITDGKFIKLWSSYYTCALYNMTAVGNNQVPRYPIGSTIYLFVSLWKILFLILTNAIRQRITIQYMHCKQYNSTQFYYGWEIY